MPVGALETGRALLGPFCLVEDIVEAHIAALGTGDLDSTFEPFFTTNGLPYGPQDTETAADSWALAERYNPGVREWFLTRDLSLAPPWIRAVYSAEKARRVLGWEPRWDFGRWWQENRDQIPATFGD